MFMVLKKDVILRLMNEMHIQYNNQWVSSPILTDTVFNFTPPLSCIIRCKTIIYSLFKNVAADRKSGAFGVSEVSGVSGVSEFQGIVFRDINDINRL